MPKDLRERVIVITGASAGIGAATAVACSRSGMRLVLTARRVDLLERVARDCATSPAAPVCIPGDVTDSTLSQRLLDVAYERFGRCDAVFANAGYGIRRLVHLLEDAEHRRIFEVNYFAAVNLLQVAARRWLETKSAGHLLMCSSAVAKFTLPRFSAYSATKAAQNHVCRAMRMELRGTGIEVSSVHPIGTKTEFRQVVQSYARPDEVAEEIATPSRWMQPPERVAKAVVQCLRRPRPEVWTSVGARILAASDTLFPGVLDWVMGRRG